jgi:RNA polymerase sigma factor (sigma-70 family)
MSELPATLKNLLADDSPSDDAWDAFAKEFTRLLIHVARSTSTDHDEAMDAYASLLEKFREDRCRRLRAYSLDPRSKFTTWLVVVSRRICLDHYRVRFGRVRDEHSASERDRRDLRRKLTRLSGGSEPMESLPDEVSASPVTELERAEISGELQAMRAALAPPDRLLLALRFDDGLSASEIAVVLGYPSPFHVYRRLNAILADMKARLKSRGYENAAS